MLRLLIVSRCLRRWDR